MSVANRKGGRIPRSIRFSFAIAITEAMVIGLVNCFADGVIYCGAKSAARKAVAITLMAQRTIFSFIFQISYLSFEHA